MRKQVSKNPSSRQDLTIDSPKEILFRDWVVSSFQKFSYSSFFVIYMFFVCDLCVFLFVCLLLYLWLFAQHVSSHAGREQSLGWNNWRKPPKNYLQVFVINYIIQLISVQTTRIALFICPCYLAEICLAKYFWENNQGSDFPRLWVAALILKLCKNISFSEIFVNFFPDLDLSTEGHVLVAARSLGSYII